MDDKNNFEPSIVRRPGRPRKTDMVEVRSWRQSTEAIADPPKEAPPETVMRFNVDGKVMAQAVAEAMAAEYMPDVQMRPAPAVKTHVTMKRNPAHYPAPHTANVHIDEVHNWAKYGWEHAD